MTPRVRLLGRPRIEDDGQPCRQPRGFKSWALLARVTLTERAVPRRELAGELFADADDPLGALRWSLADLRGSLGLPTALRGDPVRLHRDDLWLDVWALEDGTLATDDIGGTLLDGVDPENCPAFDTWLLLARSTVATRSMEGLRERALQLLATGEGEAAVSAAGLAARLSPLDESAQELFLRALVATGREAQASVHLAACLATFDREGIVPSAALREATRGRGPGPRVGLRAAVVASSLLKAGTAALSAGAADAGVETLRRAAEEAAAARDATLEAEVLTALGSALVHAVRGSDGEGAVVLHRALVAARNGQSPALAAEALRELAFIDVQAGRHGSASHSLRAAAKEAEAAGDESLVAGIEAIGGMNVADRGRHERAVVLLTQSAATAERAGHRRQQAWSLGVLARSLFLAGHVDKAQQAAEASIDLAQQDRWNAFLPWPQVFVAQSLAEKGDWKSARYHAESAFALGCQLGDPCWEGMAGRALGVIAQHAGDRDGARAWIHDARTRSDRVPDRYAWVSAYIGLADLELAVDEGPEAAALATARLHEDAVHADLPEFLAWALVHEAEAGEPGRAALARTVADGVTNPALQRRIRALVEDPVGA